MKLSESWKEYKNKAVPQDAGTVQVLETRRAFYYGALIVLKTLKDPSLDDEELLIIIDGMEEEIRKFDNMFQRFCNYRRV